MKKISLEWIKELFIIILGNALMGLAYLFILRANLITGGMGGIAIVIEKLSGFDVSLIIFILNWLLFLLGLIILGKKFALKTILSAICYPLFVFLFHFIPESVIANVNQVDTARQLIYALVSGAISGVGLGIVFKIGGSTGGVDIIAIIINKKTRIRLDKIVFYIDGIIIASGLFVINWVNVVIGLISALITSMLINRIIIGGTETVMVQIISNKHYEINDFIINKMERGATYIPALGGYQQEDRLVLQTVITIREYPLLIEYIHKTDKQAFVTSFNAKDIYGNGFSEFNKN